MISKLFITPVDISNLRGITLRNAQRCHLALRKRLTPPEALRAGDFKKSLTIAEYCSLTMEPYKEIYFELRGEIPLFDPNA